MPNLKDILARLFGRKRITPTPLNTAQIADADLRNAFPAQELVRSRRARVPRNWEERWLAAGGTLRDGGRMVALRTDPIWGAISRFGTPYPPFDFNSGMVLRDITRTEAEDLGLLAPEDNVPPALDPTAGRIDFEWGRHGRKAVINGKTRTDGYGISHIQAKHSRDLKHLPEIIAKGEIRQSEESPFKIEIHHAGRLAVLEKRSPSHNFPPSNPFHLFPAVAVVPNLFLCLEEVSVAEGDCPGAGVFVAGGEFVVEVELLADVELPCKAEAEDAACAVGVGVQI